MSDSKERHDTSAGHAAGPLPPDEIQELMAAARDAMAEALKLAETLSDQLSVELLLAGLESEETQSGDEKDPPDSGAAG